MNMDESSKNIIKINNSGKLSTKETNKSIYNRRNTDISNNLRNSSINYNDKNKINTSNNLNNTELVMDLSNSTNSNKLQNSRINQPTKDLN